MQPCSCIYTPPSIWIYVPHNIVWETLLYEVDQSQIMSCSDIPQEVSLFYFSNKECYFGFISPTVTQKPWTSLNPTGLHLPAVATLTVQLQKQFHSQGNYDYIMITEATHSNSLFFMLKYFHHVYEMIYAENSALDALWFKYNKYLITVFSM